MNTITSVRWRNAGVAQRLPSGIMALYNHGQRRYMLGTVTVEQQTTA